MTSTTDPYNSLDSFEWHPEHQTVLEHIASNDTLDPKWALGNVSTVQPDSPVGSTEWQSLREMIKYKIGQNITLFLADDAQPVELPKPATGIVDSSGSLRLPPFPPRKPNEIYPHETPKTRMNQDEANEMKNCVFRQLHEFDDNPPFTIQRVCELCVHPRQHYKVVGKYLRAVERSLLVTSTWDAFPVGVPPNGVSTSTILPVVLPAQSAPTTPMFSPIPFLHDDARRSKSRSAPPSPLGLATAEMGGSTDPIDEPMQQRAIGLVDELDDPSPGHMSDHPTAISSVTTIRSRPFLETLETRFVRGSKDESGVGKEQQMAIDEADERENKM